MAKLAVQENPPENHVEPYCPVETTLTAIRVKQKNLPYELFKLLTAVFQNHATHHSFSNKQYFLWVKDGSCPECHVIALCWSGWLHLRPNWAEDGGCTVRHRSPSPVTAQEQLSQNHLAYLREQDQDGVLASRTPGPRLVLTTLQCCHH